MSAPDLHRRQAEENLERVATMLRSTEGLPTRDPGMATLAQAQVGALVALAQALLDIGGVLRQQTGREGS